MSIHSIITEQDLINLRKLADQQRNQRALKIKNRILKETLDIKLAESFSPITTKLDEVNEYFKKIGEVIEKPQPENNIPQPAIEHPQPHQPIENFEGVIYDTELENTIKNLKNNAGFLKTIEDEEHGWMWNGYPVEILGGTEVQINDYKYNITPGIQKVLVDSSYNTNKSMNDMDKVVFGDMLQKTDYFNRIPTKGRMSGLHEFNKNNLDNDVKKI